MSNSSSLFLCAQGVGSIHFSKPLTLLPYLPAQCAHSVQFSWHNPSTWEFTLSFGNWSAQSRHLALVLLSVLLITVQLLVSSALLLSSFSLPPCFLDSPGPLNADLILGCFCLTSSSSSSRNGTLTCGLLHAEETMLFQNLGFFVAKVTFGY